MNKYLIVVAICAFSLSFSLKAFQATKVNSVRRESQGMKIRKIEFLPAYGLLGDIVYDKSQKEIYVYTGDAWRYLDIAWERACFIETDEWIELQGLK